MQDFEINPDELKRRLLAGRSRKPRPGDGDFDAARALLKVGATMLVITGLGVLWVLHMVGDPTDRGPVPIKADHAPQVQRPAQTRGLDGP